ncbi:hypothetical protein Rcae01_00422 [Novipirellula caenicola]|uniref:Uncharacterized protein n=1 Tax=Novipirellula caenicola TaxID=1536901 RepID=A0ABP9VNJ0_9BACT
MEDRRSRQNFPYRKIAFLMHFLFYHRHESNTDSGRIDVTATICVHLCLSAVKKRSVRGPDSKFLLKVETADEHR